MAELITPRPPGTDDGAGAVSPGHFTAEPVMIGATTASSPLWQTDTLSRQVVDHLMAAVTPCAKLSGGQIDGEVTAAARACLELMASALDAESAERPLAHLRQAGAQWAREGIPIDVVNHAVHEGMKAVVRNLTATSAGADIRVLTEMSLRLVDAMSRITATVASAYVRELRLVVGEQHFAMRTLATALLDGRPTHTVARQCGLTVANSYFVVAAWLSARTAASPPPGNSPRSHPAARRAAIIRRELTAHCPDALCLLHADRGTLLVPTSYGDKQLDALVTHLARAGGSNLVAVVVISDVPQIPDTQRWVHELLDVARRVRRNPGLYRFPDLALDYQLTRPGPALEPLSRLLDPLDGQPELLHTLSQYFVSGCSSTRTARVMHIHANTLRNRFERIATLVGVDPASPSGAWRLHSALLARATTGSPPAPDHRLARRSRC